MIMPSIASLLSRHPLIQERELTRCSHFAEDAQVTLEEAVVVLGILSESQLLDHLSACTGLPANDLTSLLKRLGVASSPDTKWRHHELRNMFSLQRSYELSAVPESFEDGELTLLTCAGQLASASALHAQLGLAFRLEVTTEAKLEQARDLLYRTPLADPSSRPQRLKSRLEAEVSDVLSTVEQDNVSDQAQLREATAQKKWIELHARQLCRCEKGRDVIDVLRRASGHLFDRVLLFRVIGDEAYQVSVRPGDPIRPLPGGALRVADNGCLREAWRRKVACCDWSSAVDPHAHQPCARGTAAIPILVRAKVAFIFVVGRPGALAPAADVQLLLGIVPIVEQTLLHLVVQLRTHRVAASYKSDGTSYKSDGTSYNDGTKRRNDGKEHKNARDEVDTNDLLALLRVPRGVPAPPRAPLWRYAS